MTPAAVRTAYREYRPSKVDWLGKLPSHWKELRLGQLFRERREKVSDAEFPPLSVTMGGIVPQLETAAKTQAGDNRKLVRKGDFVINSRSDRKGSSGLSDRDGSVSLIAIVLKPIGIHPHYAHHLLRSVPFQEEFYRYGKGIVADLWSTNYNEMKNIVLPVPGESEQRNIAAFLDHETTRIDQLIAKQERLIELLKEKRRAVISHAVTKGLNPDAPMKDSGIEWLGEVPAHWSTPSARHLFLRIEQGKSPQCEDRLASLSEWGVLKTGCVNRGIFREDEHKALPTDQEPFRKARVRSGDVLMSRASGSIELLGSVAFVSNVRPKLLLSDKIYRIVPTKSVIPRFLVLVMNSTPLRRQIELAVSGAEGLANNISKESVKELAVALPPKPEQESIVAFVESDLAKIDVTIEKVLRAIGLLKERRSSVISDAVTGKFDVRDWAPSQPAPKNGTAA